jgi:hypothetical protein
MRLQLISEDHSIITFGKSVGETRNDIASLLGQECTPLNLIRQAVLSPELVLMHAIISHLRVWIITREEAPESKIWLGRRDHPCKETRPSIQWPT